MSWVILSLCGWFRSFCHDSICQLTSDLFVECIRYNETTIFIFWEKEKGPCMSVLFLSNFMLYCSKREKDLLMTLFIPRFKCRHEWFVGLVSCNNMISININSRCLWILTMHHKIQIRKVSLSNIVPLKE